MSVNVRQHPRGGWDVDINVLLATGDRHRERRKLSASYSKTTAREWGERRERELLLTGPKVRKEVPTLEAFAPRFIEGYARANRQKPSGVAAKESILRLHLVPELGSRTLETISNEQVQRLKLRLHDKSPKTINNVLSVLNVLLKQAVEWGVLDKIPCSIRLVRVPRASSTTARFVRPPLTRIVWRINRSSMSMFVRIKGNWQKYDKSRESRTPKRGPVSGHTERDVHPARNSGAIVRGSADWPCVLPMQ